MGTHGNTNANLRQWASSGLFFKPSISWGYFVLELTRRQEEPSEHGWGEVSGSHSFLQYEFQYLSLLGTILGVQDAKEKADKVLFQEH